MALFQYFCAPCVLVCGVILFFFILFGNVGKRLSLLWFTTMIIAWTNFPFCSSPLSLYLSLPLPVHPSFPPFVFSHFTFHLWYCSTTLHFISCPLSFFLFLSFTLLLMAATLAFSLAAAAAAAQGPRLIATSTGQVLPPPALRPPTPAGAPIMNLIRPTQMAAMLPNGTPTLVPPTPDGGLIYTTPYEYPYALAPTSLLEYPIEHSGVLGKRAWGSMGAAGTATSFSQPGQEASLFYPGAGVLDAASMSHSQDLLKGKYVVSTWGSKQTNSQGGCTDEALGDGMTSYVAHGHFVKWQWGAIITLCEGQANGKFSID